MATGYFAGRFIDVPASYIDFTTPEIMDVIRADLAEQYGNAQSGEVDGDHQLP